MKNENEKSVREGKQTREEVHKAEQNRRETPKVKREKESTRWEAAKDQGEPFQAHRRNARMKEAQKRERTHTLQLDGLDGDALLAHAEELKGGELGLARLGVSVHLDAQEVALVLPVKLAL